MRVGGLGRGSAEPAHGCSPCQEERGWVEAASFKRKANRTSSLTELANGILFPHSNLLLILPCPGLQVKLHWEGAHPKGGVDTTVPSWGAAGSPSGLVPVAFLSFLFTTH